MWNPFKKRALLSDENEIFQIETYKWLLSHFGGVDFYNETKLILPTEEYFPLKFKEPEEATKYTFEQVKKYSGLEKWPCKLEIQEEDPELLVGDLLMVQGVENNPHGTFTINENNEAVITYNPKLASDPTQMVSTFSHELAHYLTSTAPEPPPGGWENWEFATDITATFLGFGIFQANSVFNFQQYQGIGTQGWQTTGGGYLSETEQSYSLAIFLMLKEISPEIAYPYCDGNIKVLLKNALKEIENKDFINELRKVEYIEQSS